MIDEQKSHPQKIVERYFKKTDSQHKKSFLQFIVFKVRNMYLMNYL